MAEEDFVIRDIREIHVSPTLFAVIVAIALAITLLIVLGAVFILRRRRRKTRQ